MGDWIGNLIGLEGHIRTIGEGYAVFLTILSALVGWLARSRVATKMESIKRAREYVNSYNKNVNQSFETLHNILKTKSQFPKYDPTIIELKISKRMKKTKKEK